MQASLECSAQSNGPGAASWRRSHPPPRQVLIPCLVIIAFCWETMRTSAQDAVPPGVQSSATNLPFQRISTNTPPLSPTLFNPDPSQKQVSSNLFLVPKAERLTNSTVPPRSPSLFA